MTQRKGGFFGWLGRQVGYVRGAIRAGVPAIVYRRQNVEEAKLPDRPELTLRRTTIDEVIVDTDKPAKKE